MTSDRTQIRITSHQFQTLPNQSNHTNSTTDEFAYANLTEKISKTFHVFITQTYIQEGTLNITIYKHINLGDTKKAEISPPQQKPAAPIAHMPRLFRAAITGFHLQILSP